MKQYRKLIGLAVFAFLLLWYSQCSERGSWQGREYMPDMAHSVAYEAQYNTYYYWNHWGSADEYAKFAAPRYPAIGTIARGKEIYHYANTEEDRIRASAEITTSPVPFSKQGFEKGKQLYLTYCAVCHGSKGDGADGIYKNGDGPYPAKPANLKDSMYVNANDGRFYHAIMYGKNVMGSYKDKLNEEDRWLVISYIRFLQGNLEGGKKVESTLDKDFDGVMSGKSSDSTAISKVSPVGQTIILPNVFFNTGSHVLRSSSMVELDLLVSALKKYPNVRLSINGHTDAAGDAAANMVLSQARADIVRGYLLQSGISVARLSSKGYGSTMPSGKGAAFDRRTDITIVGL